MLDGTRKGDAILQGMVQRSISDADYRDAAENG
jgi:hypothetical protein